MTTAATRILIGLAIAVAVFGAWLSMRVLAKPSEGANIGGGMAVMGTGAAALGIVLGFFAVLKGGEKGRASAAALASVLIALAFLALPTLAHLFPDM